MEGDRHAALMDAWWACVQELIPLSGNELLFDEYPDLQRAFNRARRSEIAALAVADFDPIGGAVNFLTDEQYLLALPAIIRCALESGDPIFATSVVWRLEELSTRSAEWPVVRGRVPDRVAAELSADYGVCCRLGWEDERRFLKHRDRCRSLWAAT